MKKSRSVVYKTTSLEKAFAKLDLYSLTEVENPRKFFVRLELAFGERKTYEYTNSSDTRDRLLGNYRKFISLIVSL